jgi:hypothetical protein
MRGIYHRGSRVWIRYAGPPGRRIVYESTGQSDVALAALVREQRIAEVANGTWRPVTPTRQRTKRRSISVYFLADPVSQLVKIGTAHDVAARVRSIELMSPVPLVLLGVIAAGGRRLEASLHRRFQAHRSHGEWFFLAPEIVELIAEVDRFLDMSSADPTKPA